ncbi:class I SAM-dependent methyltransferase [Gordonia rhizosphera]|uniref:Putative methyltransferase n=1 Tax=Gordonia rhizosphera NBRC 16068 TaxID=1108045 RepID=K6W8P0_9ACTN|nr:class I SAM-dependent methyltransferase [Gordonia rhizosphera]GAB90116.1 putative methyltransferase [Gordonia rhizosphera NBRC 16068]
MFSESDGYDRFMGRWSRRLAPPMVAFAGVGEGCAVLDVGCGTGALTFAAAEIGSVTVTGVDPAEAYVDTARRCVRGRSVSFDVGSALSLPYADAAFDATLSMLVMNFLADPAAAVREMIRVTRAKGVVAAAVWDYGEGMEMLRVFWDEAVAVIPAAASRDERAMPLCRSGELGELWRAEGLSEVEERALTIDLDFGSFDDYWEPFTFGQGPAGSFVASLSEPERRALQARLRDRLLVGGPDHSFALRARAWAVRGVVAP